MARQWVSAIGGVAVHEVGTEEYVVPIGGFAFQEDQTAVVAANPKGPLGMPLHGPFGGPIGA